MDPFNETRPLFNPAITKIWDYWEGAATYPPPPPAQQQPAPGSGGVDFQYFSAPANPWGVGAGARHQPLPSVQGVRTSVASTDLCHQQAPL